MKFKEKWENYWYHYKTRTLLGAVILLSAVYAFVQCAADVKPDLTIAYISYTYADLAMFEENSGALAKAAGDANGDGKTLAMLDPMVLGNSPDLRQDGLILQKIQLSFIVGEDRLYLLDPEVLENPDYAELFMPLEGLLTESALEGGVEFQGAVIAAPCLQNGRLEEMGIKSEGLYIAIRNISVADEKIKNIDAMQSSAMNGFRYIMSGAVKNEEN